MTLTDERRASPRVSARLTGAREAVSVEEFTPEYCKHVLDNLNRNPRKLRPSKAAQYASDMAEGRWAEGLSVIGFDADGMLVDGQHRFGACVMCGVPFTSICSRGVSQEAVDNVDRGFRRSVADVLRQRGEINVVALQAGLNMAWRWDNHGVLSNAVATWHQLETYLAEHPELREAVVLAGPLQKPPLNIRAVVIAFIQRIRVIDEHFGAADFIDRLQHGTGMERDDPILRLREMFLARRAHLYGRPSREHDLALLVKAWNAHITGRSLKMLKWNRGGGREEAFPALVGHDGKPWPFPDVIRDVESRAKLEELLRDSDDDDT